MVPTNRYDRGVEVSGVTSNRAAVPLPNSRAGSRALRLLRFKACVLLLLIAVFSSCNPPHGGGSSGDGGTPTPPVPKAWHVTTFAGGGARGASGGDGIGTAASFGLPFSIAQSGDTLYVIDLSMHSIRSVNTTTARVGTIVTGGSRGYRNGAGTSALFHSPRGAAATAGGVLYVADTGGHRIREVRTGSSAADARVSDLAGKGASGYFNGAGADAQFSSPMGLALRDGSTLYVAEFNNHRIRAVDLASPNKIVSTIAGGNRANYIDGAGTVARFNRPAGLALSGTTLYVADYNNHRIRAIDLASPNKTVSTIAGSGKKGHSDGAGTAAQFNSPIDLAVGGTTLYVADEKNHRIRAIDLASPNKTVSTIAGDGTRGNTNGIGTAARFKNPYGIAVSGGTLYVASGALIRKLEYRETGS